MINGEVTISNWQTYTGAIVGGAVGGAILGGTGCVGAANAATGLVTTGLGQALEKLTIEGYDQSWTEIGINAAVDGAVSFGLGKLPGVKGVTSGRNSMSAVYKSGLTSVILQNPTSWISGIDTFTYASWYNLGDGWRFGYSKNKYDISVAANAAAAAE